MADPKTAIGLLTMCVMLLVASGCGSGSKIELGAVEGTVTYQGKPLEYGRVVFSPEKDTTGPQAVGTINADGSFEMQTGEHHGAPLGGHVVTVHCRQKPTPEQERDMNFIPKSLIPEKYSREDETPLRFEVKQGGGEYAIELE